MSRLFYHTMQDNAGNLLFDVSGTMRLAGSSTLATIYGDEALTVILPNPMTNHPSFGSFKCFLPVGDFDFYMAKSGYTFETLTGVQGHGTMAQLNADYIPGSLRIDGTVGIGRAVDPSYSLATAGAIYAGGTMQGQGNLDLLGTAGIGGNLTVGGSTALTGTITSDVRIDGEVGIGRAADPAFSLATAAAIYVGGTIQGQGNLDLLGTAVVGANLSVTGSGTFAGLVTAERVATGLTLATTRMGLGVARATYDGLTFRPDADSGAKVPARFLNAAGTQVGYIDTTATATVYGTSSDARLKHAIAPLQGALDVVRALNPVSFLWNADGSRGRGLLAQEVAAVVPGVVSGDGASDVPMGIDYSKLVPWLIGAVKELTQQVEALTAKLAAAGA